MVALTKEKREELANYARARLASHVMHGGCSDEEEIFKIALASLTAEPVAFIHENMLSSMVGEDPRVCGRVWSSSVDELSNERRTPLFTAPPVPEIKFPTEQDLEALFMTSGEYECQSREEWDLDRGKRLSSINDCKLMIEEIKHLNGWKSEQ